MENKQCMSDAETSNVIVAYLEYRFQHKHTIFFFDILFIPVPY